ncbi:hypothetical protein ACQ86E_21335 [Bradyrhizobium betae]|uniref:hypothetical protein n=1 Tax=Bradyrhizobium betae TaxID=244734 RepID=UPI003D667C63
MRLVPRAFILASALLLTADWAGAAELRRFGDHQLFTKGPFSAFMDPFNKREYVAGKDFDQSFTVDPENFPVGTTITWNWPIRDPKFIVGFLQAAAYGDYFNTVPQRQIRPSRINEIQQLSVSHDLSFSGTHNGFDVIYDYFLTKAPRGWTSRLFEIEVFLRTPEYSVKYFNTATPIGTFSHDGVQWKVAIDRRPKVPDILFIPVDHADHAKGSIDLQAMHLFLKSKGILTGDEYYNGHSLGVEPAQGTGSFLVNSVSVDYR